MPRVLFMTIAILLAVGPSFGAMEYSLHAASHSCGSGSRIPSGYTQLINTILHNATFLSLEHGDSYQFTSIAQQQIQYNNGNSQWSNTVIEFTCDPAQCNPAIDAVVTSQAKIIQIYIASGGQINFHPNPSSTATAPC